MSKNRLDLKWQEPDKFKRIDQEDQPKYHTITCLDRNLKVNIGCKNSLVSQ